MSFFYKSGIVNVRMVITEEKILSNIDKVQKLINPNSKKQIVQLDEDSYFKDLVESIKTYLIEYPKKKNFPKSVYKASYDLVEYATNQFEENTKKIEDLIRQREKNIKLAGELKTVSNIVKKKDKTWKEAIKAIENKFSTDIPEALNIMGKSKSNEAESYVDANKLIEAKINNLESNLHIEIDMERIEDRSKALSYIGIEIAEALKYIPAPLEDINTVEIKVETPVIEQVEQTEGKVEKIEEPTVATVTVEEVVNTPEVIEEAPIKKKASKKETVAAAATVEPTFDENTYFEETRFDVKPSLWQRIKNSKLVQKIRYIMKIRVVLELPALPEGKGNY